MHATLLAELIGATKRYGPVTVLHDVPFDVRPGEVHVLAGENGAGKSTLIKILGGVITDYEGTLRIEGKEVRLHSAKDAADSGVAVIHQELSLVPTMTVLDNLYLGDIPHRRGFVRRSEMTAGARTALERVGLEIALDAQVSDLPIATQQLVEVAKALRRDAKVVVMDEPTSALNIQEAQRLFQLISDLKARGCGIVYISHKMEEIEALADRITVLRDGLWVATEPAQQVPVDRLVRLMVGEKGLAVTSGKKASAGDVALSVKEVTVERRGRALVQEASLEVRKGEVVGIAGLEGSGNSALLNAIFGSFGRLTHGTIELDGTRLHVRGPADVIRHGIALLTSDRKANGLVLPLSVSANATLTDLPRLSRMGWRRPKAETAAANRLVDQLRIRTSSVEAPVSELSGGNQQKVALAKWVQIEPKVLMLDEPTRGIDINAKREIYALIDEWKSRGIAILLITSELPELLLLSDRILVMHRGRIVKEMPGEEATPDLVIQAAMNAHEEPTRN